MADEDKKRVINTVVLKQRIRIGYYFIRPLAFIILLALALILINRFYLDAGKVNHGLIIQYFQVLQWPIVILFLYFIFRPYLPEMIPRIKKIWGIELDNELPIQPEFGESLATETASTTAKQVDITTPAGRADAIQSDSNLRWLLERTYRFAYGTQISALGLLQQGSGSMEIQDLKFLYDKHVQLSTSPFATIYEWLRFLTANGLASQTGESIEITDIGRLFLEYLAIEGVSDPIYRHY